MKLNTDKSILDLDRLLEVYDDDHEGMLELLEMMLKNNSGKLAELERAAEAQDLTGVQKAAHAMKGSSGNVGGMEVHRLAKEIEEIARDGSWEGIHERVKSVHAAFNRLRREVESLQQE